MFCRELKYYLYTNCNILTLGRYGASDVTPEDSFTYTYNGNKLVNLSGTCNGATLSNANYRYDENGNMTHDGRKGIDITYDINNMPQTVSRNDTLKAAYTYLSDGTKEMVQDRTDNTSSNGYLYLGSMVFKKTGTSYAFESTDFGGGRIINVNGTLTAYYYITDHLGSVRAITDAGGNVVERNDYYPFGKNMTTGNTYPTMSVNRWKYNGKETQTTGEVNWLDYGARMYDEVIGRWTRVDPHANKYYNYSPYVYCLNNPLRYIDSIGKDGDVEINNNKIKISVSIYIYGSGASAQQATKMQTAIMTDWNRGFSYIDPETKQKYAVNFDVKVQVYDKNNPQKGPGLFSDKNNPFSTSNFIEVGATAKDINRSYVKGGDEGRWRGYGSDPSSHEFGHLIGLRDHYSDVNGIEADWKGNVMAEPAGKGEVEQKNIDAVASPLLNRYHKSGNKTQIFRTKIDENNPNW